VAAPEALLTLAELALGLAGFTGVIVVFGRDPKAPWHAVDAFRVARMLSASFGGLFFSLLPEGMLATGLSAVTTWRIGSALLLGYLLLAGRSTLLAARALGPEERAYLDVRYLRAVPLLLGAVALVLASNALGVWWRPGYPAYYLGVLSLLGFAAFQFVRIVFVRPGAR
jgi:hypothetical protein